MNKFEFVVVSGARARQLQAGCTPRVEQVEKDSEKPARVAMKEVRQGKIERIRIQAPDRI